MPFLTDAHASPFQQQFKLNAGYSGAQVRKAFEIFPQNSDGTLEGLFSITANGRYVQKPSRNDICEIFTDVPPQKKPLEFSIHAEPLYLVMESSRGQSLFVARKGVYVFINPEEGRSW